MPNLKTQRKKNWIIGVTKRDREREWIVVNHNFTFLSLFADAATSTKEGDVAIVDALGGE